MNRRPISSLTAAAVLAVALTACVAPSGGGTHSGSGGGSTGGGNQGDVHGGGSPHPCEATFKPAGDLTGITASNIGVKATLWVKCETPPTEHHLTLELQRYNTSRYNTIETRNIDKIPPEIYQAMLVTADCKPGKWRLKWSITGTVNGQPVAGGATGEPYDVKVSDCA